MAPLFNATSGVQGDTYKKLPTFEQKSVLGMDEFFKILSAQMMNQDPLNPMDDREFITQMTTFNTLQQITEMNQTFKDLRGIMLGQSTGMIGKEITYSRIVSDPNNPDVKNKEILSSTVLWVENDKGRTLLQLANGDRVELDDVLQLFEPKSPVIDNSHLIGKKLTYLVRNNDNTTSEETGVVQAVSYKDGVVQLVLDTGEKIRLGDVLKVESP